MRRNLCPEVAVVTLVFSSFGQHGHVTPDGRYVVSATVQDKRHGYMATYCERHSLPKSISFHTSLEAAKDACRKHAEKLAANARVKQPDLFARRG